MPTVYERHIQITEIPEYPCQDSIYKKTLKKIC